VKSLQQELLSVGKILNFHGIKGEVKIGFTEGNEKILSEVNEVYIVKDSETIKLEIDKLRFHKKFAIVKFKEIDSIDDALEYKGNLIRLPKKQLVKYLEKDEFYITDLVGLKAYDPEEIYIGEVSGVMNIKHQDTLFIKTEDGVEYLVPFKKEIVPEINMKKGKIIIKPIEGLLE